MQSNQAKHSIYHKCSYNSIEASTQGVINPIKPCRDVVGVLYPSSSVFNQRLVSSFQVFFNKDIHNQNLSSAAPRALLQASFTATGKVSPQRTVDSAAFPVAVILKLGFAVTTIPHEPATAKMFTDPILFLIMAAVA